MPSFSLATSPLSFAFPSSPLQAFEFCCISHIQLTIVCLACCPPPTTISLSPQAGTTGQPTTTLHSHPLVLASSSVLPNLIGLNPTGGTTFFSHSHHLSMTFPTPRKRDSVHTHSHNGYSDGGEIKRGCRTVASVARCYELAQSRWFFASCFCSFNHLQVFLEEATGMDRNSFASTTNGFVVHIESICVWLTKKEECYRHFVHWPSIQGGQVKAILLVEMTINTGTE